MPRDIKHADESLAEAPAEFICPISLSVMKNPVMSRDGQNFEKHAILDWLNRGNTNCPLTRQPLKASLLAPNVNLKMKIQRWRRSNKCMLDDDDDTCNSSDFVGLLDVDHHDSEIQHSPTESGREAAEYHLAQEIQRRVDYELFDLMELYNEVLELTSSPLDSMPPPSRRPSPFGSRGPTSRDQTDTAISAIIARNMFAH
jgi:U-box domain